MGLLPQRVRMVASGVALGVCLGVALLLGWSSASLGGPLPRPVAPLALSAAEVPSRTAPDDAGADQAERDSSRTRVAPRDRVRAPERPPPALEPLTTMYDWPTEPPVPDALDERRFAEALAQLCNAGADSPVRNEYAGWIAASAREFGTDPFLLGALVFARSGCDARGGAPWLGLTGLVVELYERDVREGRYHYVAFFEGAWVERSIPVDRFPFTRAVAKAAEPNLYFAAAFLRAWQERQRGLFVSLPQREYRHYVSHFVWGDLVRSNRQEDHILVQRRRLLEYYGARKPVSTVSWQGVELGCPLDGCPRVVTSNLGDLREGGKRAHRGVDFESNEGEPVRAAADGRVLFAGVDLPGAAHKRTSIHAQRRVARSLFGAGGIYVCITHTPNQSVISCYMHLATAMVEQGRIVHRGEPIGTVGRTGIKESPAHLHFELHAGRAVHPATEALRGIALGRAPARRR